MNEILDIAQSQLKDLGCVDIYKIASLTRADQDYIRQILEAHNITSQMERFG